VRTLRPRQRRFARISVNHVCETTDDSPHANTVRGHLTDQFEPDSVEAIEGTLLQQDALATLLDRPVEVTASLHFDPYYGNEGDTEALYSSQAKRGPRSTFTRQCPQQTPNVASVPATPARYPGYDISQLSGIEFPD